MLTETILKLPHGPAVPYHAVLRATRETMGKLATAMLNKPCKVQLSATASTAAVSWGINGAGGVTIDLAMPAIAPTTMLPRSEADRMVALLIHELCHVAHTDRRAWEHVCNHPHPLLRPLVNALEDARIERRVIADGAIPSARELFAALSEHYLQEALGKGFRIVTPRDLVYGFAILGRTRLGQKIPSARKIVIAPYLQPVIDRALPLLSRCRDTSAVVDLAQMILRDATTAEADKARQEAQEAQEAQEGTEGTQEAQEGTEGTQEAQEGTEGTQEAQEGTEGTQEAQEGTEGTQEAQEGTEGTQEAQEGTEGTQDAQEGTEDAEGAQEAQEGTEGTEEGTAPANGAGTEPPDVQPPTLADVLARIAERNPEPEIGEDYREYADTHGQQLAGWRGALVWQPEQSRTGPVTPNPYIVNHARTAIPNPGAIKQTIRRWLRAPDSVATTHRLTSGKLDRRALPRIPTGARDVFQRSTYADAVNVGVVLLLDASSSMMEGTRLPMARSLALHFGDACEQAGAQSAILSFEQREAQADEAGKDAFVRVLKRWHERMTVSTATRLLDDYNPAGGTALAPGIMAAADMLAAKPDFSRRIIIALTDGVCHSLPRGVSWADVYATRKGCETIGVLLEPDCLAEMAANFPHHNGGTLGFNPARTVIVPNAASLASLALGALARAIRGA